MEPTSFLPAFLKRKLTDRPNLVKVINNSGWLVLDKLVRGVLTLVVGAWVARYLGPEQFGQLSYVLAYLAFFQVVANLGMDGIIVRDIAQIQAKSHQPSVVSNQSISSALPLGTKLKPENCQLTADSSTIGTILGTAFTMRLIAGVICWLLAIVGMGLTEGWQSQLVWLTALAGGTLVFQAADTIDLWFQSQSQSKRTVWAKISAYVVSNGIKVGLILGQFPMVYFAGVILIEFGITAATLAYAYWRLPCGSEWQKRVKTQGKQIILQSWVYIFIGLAIIVSIRIDQIMIRNILGDKELGIYSIVITIAQMFCFIPGIMVVSLSPYLNKGFVSNKKEYCLRYTLFFRLMLISGMTISFFTIFIADRIIILLYGDGYGEGSQALKIYALTIIPIFLGTAQGNWIINNNRQSLLFKQTLLGAVVLVLCNFYMIPAFGMLGASLSSVMSSFSSALLLNFLLEKELFYMQIGLAKKYS